MIFPISCPQEGSLPKPTIAALIRSTCALTLLPQSTLDPKSLPLGKSAGLTPDKKNFQPLVAQTSAEILADQRWKLADAQLALFVAGSKAKKERARKALSEAERRYDALLVDFCEVESPGSASESEKPCHVVWPGKKVVEKKEAVDSISFDRRDADSAKQAVPDKEDVVAVATMELLYPKDKRVVRPVPAPGSPSLEFPIVRAILGGEVSREGRKDDQPADSNELSTQSEDTLPPAEKEDSKTTSSSPPLSPTSVPLPLSPKESPTYLPEAAPAISTDLKKSTPSTARKTVNFAVSQESTHRPFNDHRPRSHYKRSSTLYSRGRWADISGSGFADTSGYHDDTWGSSRKSSDVGSTMDRLRESGLDERDWIVGDFVGSRTPRNSVAEGMEGNKDQGEREKKGFVRRAVGKGIAERAARLARKPGEFKQMARLFYSSS